MGDSNASDQRSIHLCNLPMKRSPQSLTVPRRTLRKNVGGLVVALSMLCSITGARAVVFPKTSMPGASEKYVLRVINDGDIPTVKVEIHFPNALRVIALGDVPGWKVQALTDTAQRITGAVWTGILPKDRFVEFPFVAMNPKESISLDWPTYQTYSSGERVDWISADTASKTPVSSTLIADTTPPPIRVSRTSLYISLAALLFALTALGVALRPRGVDVNP